MGRKSVSSGAWRVLGWFNEPTMGPEVRECIRSIWVHEEKFKNPWLKLYIKSIRSSFSVFTWNSVVLSCFYLLNLCDVNVIYLCKSPLLCLWSVEHQSILDNGFYSSELFIFILISCSSFSSDTHWLGDANRLSEWNMQDCETETFIVPNHLNFLVDIQVLKQHLRLQPERCWMRSHGRSMFRVPFGPWFCVLFVKMLHEFFVRLYRLTKYQTCFCLCTNQFRKNKQNFIVNKISYVPLCWNKRSPALNDVIVNRLSWVL